MHTPIRILVIEDTFNFAASCTLELERAGHIVKTASTRRTALTEVIEFTPDLVIMDLDTHEDIADQLTRAIKALNGNLAVVAISGRERAGVRATGTPFLRTLHKPLNLTDLLGVLSAPASA